MWGDSALIGDSELFWEETVGDKASDDAFTQPPNKQLKIDFSHSLYMAWGEFKKQKCCLSPGGTTKSGDLTFLLAGMGREEGLGLEE